MTFFQVSVLVLLALNICITYWMLRRLTIATLTGSFAVAHWLNPRFAKWFNEAFDKMLALNCDTHEAEYEKLNTELAEQNPECQLGREALIAAAFDAYRECRRVPKKYRNLNRSLRDG